MKKDLLKIEKEEDWAKARNFVPKKNQIIIYDGKQENGEYVVPPRVKIGDGIRKVSELPFESNVEVFYSEDDQMLRIN